MKIVVVLNHLITSGGGFNQALNAVLQVKRLAEKKFDIEVLTSDIENIEHLNALGIKSDLFRLTLIDKVITKIGASSIWPTIQHKIKFISPFEKKLLRLGCDLVYFVTPSGRPALLQRINYIFTVWDLCHRDYPEFPEVREFGIFFKRESLYRNSLNSAYLVLVDSNELQQKVVSRYGADKERVLVMPFSPSPFLQSSNNPACEIGTDGGVISKYNLHKNYFYYPAQFWPHKNHVRILEALAILKSKGVDCQVVFSGKDFGNLAYIKKYINNAKLEENVRILGFVPKEDIAELYKGCLSLVMPTYFGPTNIPPLEAWLLRKPVIYSSHLQEQVKDAAILVDPDNEFDLAVAMENFLSYGVDDLLLDKGSRRLEEIGAQRKSSERKFAKKLDTFKSRRECWN